MDGKRRENVSTSGASGDCMKARPYLKHLKSSDDLRTSYEAVRAGFVALALEKNRRATPFVAEARALKSAASAARLPTDLLHIPEIKPALVLAAGISDKASNHLNESNKQEAITRLINEFLEPAGENFVEELVFRFLLTRGDTLGGSMRNVGGILAQRRLSRAIIARLQLASVELSVCRGDSKQWVPMPEDNADIELNLRGLSWGKGDNARTLVYNLTVPLVRNNVDICLLSIPHSHEIRGRSGINDADKYLALGELKGGIDPAGADEHWKTARSALTRIVDAFAKKKLRPHTFFVGAAIEKKMAEEIWSMLRNGGLENAANLTSDGQVASLANWLCSL